MIHSRSKAVGFISRNAIGRKDGHSSSVNRYKATAEASNVSYQIRGKVMGDPLITQTKLEIRPGLKQQPGGMTQKEASETFKKEQEHNVTNTSLSKINNNYKSAEMLGEIDTITKGLAKRNHKHFIKSSNEDLQYMLMKDENYDSILPKALKQNQNDILSTTAVDKGEFFDEYSD